MKISFKISDSLKQKIMADLKIPHPFAAERVGFIGCKVAGLPNDGLILLAKDYWPVTDEDYLKDFSVGAMMGPAAIRKALQVAYTENMSMFHVHLHDHRGMPKFSRTDMSESAKFVPDFWNIRPELPHGTLVFSQNAMNGLCWLPQTKKPLPITDFTVTGSTLLRLWRK